MKQVELWLLGRYSRPVALASITVFRIILLIIVLALTVVVFLLPYPLAQQVAFTDHPESERLTIDSLALTCGFWMAVGLITWAVCWFVQAIWQDASDDYPERKDKSDVPESPTTDC